MGTGTSSGGLSQPTNEPIANSICSFRIAEPPLFVGCGTRRTKTERPWGRHPSSICATSLLPGRNDHRIDGLHVHSARIAVRDIPAAGVCAGRSPAPDPQSEAALAGHLVAAGLAGADGLEVAGAQVDARPFIVAD